MNTRNQLRFKKFRFNEARMNLHRHYGDLHAKRLIVFVHGLNGGGYRTWGKFPRFVFDDVSRDPVDVALFDYFSGLRRRVRRRPSVPEVAQILTERLQDLSKEYDEIFIISHSMGGLIATDSMRNYIAQRGEEPGLLRVLAGAIYISTPLTGSKFAHARIRLLVSEWQQLQLDSPYQEDLRRFISATIDTKSDAETASHRYKLPIWSFVGARDGVVERSSATQGIDEDQVRTIDLGHRKISKPRQLGSEVVVLARDVIDDISRLRADIRNVEETARKLARPRTPDDLVLVEFFLESDANDTWQPIYESVVQTAGSPLVHVEDKYLSGSRHSPNLLISAHRSNNLIERRTATRLKVEELRRRYDQGNAHAKAFAVGSHREPSMKALAEMTGLLHQDNQQYRLTFGSADDDEQLRIRLSECVAGIVRRQHNVLSQREVRQLADDSLQIDIDPEVP
ncbi:alpha/beta fold hydrolase [Mycolicibacterium boenickei]